MSYCYFYLRIRGARQAPQPAAPPVDEAALKAGFDSAAAKSQRKGSAPRRGRHYDICLHHMHLCSVSLMF